MKQDYLRKQVKLVKALNDDITYKALAETINISINSFYNWLGGSYSLSYEKEKMLNDITYDLAK